jgi:hypothetical protein
MGQADDVDVYLSWRSRHSDPAQAQAGFCFLFKILRQAACYDAPSISVSELVKLIE